MRLVKHMLARLSGAPAGSSGHAAGRHRPPAIPPPPRLAPSGLYPPDTMPVARPATAKVRSQTSRQRDGAEGESFARRHLERAGLAFVVANVRYRDGEIDLVMRDTGHRGSAPPTLVFVEVRRRARGTHGGAAASVTREKRRRVVAAAAHYLVGLGLRTLPACRFDVVTVEGDLAQGFRIEWIRDAFRDEG